MSITLKNKRSNALVSILFVVLIWGSGATVTKLGVQEMPPFLFALIRNGVASFFLLLFYFYRRRTNRKEPSAPIPWKKITWMGLTGITFFYVLFNLSLVHTTASTGALIQGFIPVAIALLAFFFLKEKLNLAHIAGILLSVAGVILVGFVGTDKQGEDSLWGNVLMVISVLSWGVYTVISKSLGEYDHVASTAFSTLIGTIFLIPVVLIEQWGHPLPAISANAWAAILYLAIFSSTICFILYNKALKVLPTATVGNLLNLDPVAGVVIAIIVLKDKITLWQIAGGILVLVGIALSSGASSPASKKEELL
jgi:drug/metabolite transporter (DMT)-like permease